MKKLIFTVLILQVACDANFLDLENRKCKTNEDCPSFDCNLGYCVISDDYFENQFVLIEAGEFFMGSSSTSLGHKSDENLHIVKINKNFLMQRTEVTQRQWFEITGTMPSSNESCGEQCPVENISWHEAIVYANILSRKNNLEPCYTDQNNYYYNIIDAEERAVPIWKNGLNCNGYRLPTEAEWEYAARSKTETDFWNGNIKELECDLDPNLDQVAHYCYNSSGKKMVAQKDANFFNIYDTHGNVWEWVWDWYDNYPSDNIQDPQGPPDGTSRVARGGSWYSLARECRSANRGHSDPSARHSDLGVRLVRSITIEGTP
jgi:formylglycine-generating enzyme required for sulfatase activity